MRPARSLTLPILAAVVLASCSGGGKEPSAVVAPTVTASPAAPPDGGAAVRTDDEPVDGTVEVAFADITVTAAPMRCEFDADAEAPADGSPRTVLHVLAVGPGPDGEMWEVQLSRILVDGTIIDTVSVHWDAGMAVDRYEAQRVVDTEQQQVEDLWGDSTNALLMPVVSDDELAVRPPDDVTFGVHPAEREDPAEVAGTGTFSVTCSPAVG